MDSKVCVNCGNKNPINVTTNRLVTEACGHVKCMQCLLEEKSGCVACKAVRTNSENNQIEISLEPICTPTNGEEADKEINYYTHNRKRLNTDHIISVTLSDGNTEGYLCMVCNRRFKAKAQMMYHAYCNGQKKPYECKECNRSFVTHSHYSYHMASVHGNTTRDYTCKICNASFLQKSKLQRHDLIKHSQKREFPCKKCNKAFNNASSLRKHELTHTGDRPFVCPHCKQHFRDSSNLKKHIFCKHGPPDKGRPTHRTSESMVSRLEDCKHQCPECPRAFFSRKDLRRHQLIHSERKPFVCELCDCKESEGRQPPRFRRRDNYNRHLKNTHGIRNNSSDTCSQTANGQNGTTLENPTEKVADEVEKAKLEVLNPLPPLPKEVIQKHLYTEEKSPKEDKHTIDKKTDDEKPDEDQEDTDKANERPLINKKEEMAIDNDTQKPVIDKSYIMEANNARESVIVGKVERKSPCPVPDYVHKKLKANSLSCQKEVCLPPIDARKLVELVTLYPHSKEETPRPLDTGPLLVKNVQTLKNILHAQDKHDEVPRVHWRKKRLTDKE